MTELSMRNADKFDKRPDPHMVGRSMVHNGNQKVYIILGYVWLGETDEWGFLHRAVGEDGSIIARPMSHLEGRIAPGVDRYSFFSWDRPR